MLRYQLLVGVAILLFIHFAFPSELVGRVDYIPRAGDTGVTLPLVVELHASWGQLALLSFFYALAFSVYVAVVASIWPRCRSYLLREDLYSFLPLVLMPLVHFTDAAELDELCSHVSLIQVWSGGLLASMLGMKIGILAWVVVSPRRWTRILGSGMAAALLLHFVVSLVNTLDESRSTPPAFFDLQIWTFAEIDPTVGFYERSIQVEETDWLFALWMAPLAVLTYFRALLLDPARKRHVTNILVVTLLSIASVLGFRQFLGAMISHRMAAAYSDSQLERGRRMELNVQGQTTRFLLHGTDGQLRIRVREEGRRPAAVLEERAEHLSVTCAADQQLWLVLGLVPEAESWYYPRYHLQYVVTAREPDGARFSLAHRSRRDRLDARFRFFPLSSAPAEYELSLAPTSALPAPFGAAALICRQPHP